MKLISIIFLIFKIQSNGMAQVDNKLKEIRNNYKKVEFLYGDIQLKASPFGYYLESDLKDVAKIECEKSLKEVTTYLYYFSRSITVRKDLRDRCPNYRMSKSYFASDYKLGHNLDLEDILKFYFKQKNKKDLTIENYFQVIQRLKTYRKSILREILILHWHFYFNRLDNVRIHLQEFIAKDFSEYILDLDYRSERMIINDKDGGIRLNQVLDELLTLANSRLSPIVFKSLVNFLSKFEWKEVSMELNGKLKNYIELNKDELANFLKDFRWGKTMPHNWGTMALDKLGQEFLIEYLKAFWSLPTTVKNENLVSPFLEYIYTPEYRTQIYEKILSLKNSKDLFDKKYFYDLVGSKVFSGKKHNGKIIVPVNSFQDKRSFYSELLEKKTWSIFSIYHLISLGDLKEDYLDDL